MADSRFTCINLFLKGCRQNDFVGLAKLTSRKKFPYEKTDLSEITIAFPFERFVS